MELEPMYGVNEAAKILGLSPYMVRHYARKGELDHREVAGARAYVFTASDLKQFQEHEIYLEVLAVSQAFGVTPGAVRRWVSDGKLKGHLSRGKRVFSIPELREFAAAQGLDWKGFEDNKVGDKVVDVPGKKAAAA